MTGRGPSPTRRGASARRPALLRGTVGFGRAEASGVRRLPDRSPPAGPLVRACRAGDAARVCARHYVIGRGNRGGNRPENGGQHTNDAHALSQDYKMTDSNESGSHDSRWEETFSKCRFHNTNECSPKSRSKRRSNTLN